MYYKMKLRDMNLNGEEEEEKKNNVNNNKKNKS